MWRVTLLLEKNTKKPPQLLASYDLAPWTFKSDKIAPQTTKQLHFGPLCQLLPWRWMEKLKLRRFVDSKLWKYPPGEKKKHIKALAETAPFWLRLGFPLLHKTASFCVGSEQNHLGPQTRSDHEVSSQNLAMHPPLWLKKFPSRHWTSPPNFWSAKRSNFEDFRHWR